MSEAFICDAVRTPIGRYGGSLAPCAGDDLAAIPIKALIDRNGRVDWEAVDDVILGCANQAGEDNRNLARIGRPPRGPAAQIGRRYAETAFADRAWMQSPWRRG
jgi:acetyl-CoA acetyltransferase